LPASSLYRQRQRRVARLAGILQHKVQPGNPIGPSGKGGIGQWQSLKRNVREDYKKVFGEEPSPLKSITAFTDADNTGTKVEAWYGDIALTDK